MATQETSLLLYTGPETFLFLDSDGTTLVLWRVELSTSREYEPLAYDREYEPFADDREFELWA